LLGFEAEISVDKLYVYDISGIQVLEVRSLLNRKEIPNTVCTIGKRLYAITSAECKNLRDRLTNISSLGQEHSADDFHQYERLKLFILPRLASSAIRLNLRREKWNTSGSKVFNPEEREDLLQGVAQRYRAYTVAVHYYRRADRYFVSIDPCFKLETSMALDRLRNDERALIHLVKIRGGHFAFELLGIENGSKETKKIAYETFKALKEIEPRLIEEGGGGVARVYPRSLQLKSFLSDRNLLVKESMESYVYLPLSSLCPVPSLENLKVLGVDLSEHPMWKTPTERYKEAIELAKAIEEVEINGLKIKVIDTEPISVGYEKILKPTAKSRNDQLVELGDIVSRDAWKSCKIAPIREGKPLRVALVNGHPNVDDKVINALKDELKDILKIITNKLAEVLIVQKIDEAIENSCNALIYVGPGDSPSYPRIEYNVANRGVIPQYIDGDKLIGLDERKKVQHARYRAFPIAKSIAFRAGWRYLRLDPPPALESAIVAGVDRTYVYVGKGVSLGVVPVFMSPDGLEIEHLNPILGENEESIFMDAARVLKDKLRQRKAETLVLLINRATIPEELMEILGNEYDEIVCVSATKTHNYSRLLKREHDGKYVNPFVGEYCVLDENSNSGAYLVSASSLGKSWDRTVKPVLVHVNAKGLTVKPRDVLKYIFDMYLLNIEGVYFPASLPWPLHRADRLCKKLYMIASSIRQVPSGSELEYL
jgi:hypothetical protein